MGKMFETWRYYSFGKEQYNECMGNVFANNLHSLRQANVLFAIFATCLSLLSLLIDRNFLYMVIQLIPAVIAVLLALYANYKLQTMIANNKFIYVFSTLFYLNVIAFGIVLYIWVNPAIQSAIFFCLLICSLLMFINPPHFNLVLTLGAMTAFIVFSFIFKPAVFTLNIVNTLAAGLLSLYFCWHITKLRISLETSTTMLEEERNKYLDQSTVDELTKLKNRRDFMQTFQRYLSSYRTSDYWLCIAIVDIDFFKLYNDHYGHPMGDECLRSLGNVLNTISYDMSVYSARVGGEEFALLWFEKDTSHVNVVISNIFNMIREMKIPHKKSKVHEYLTVSIGVYIEQCGASNETKALYQLADNVLYNAKASGRNCAVITGREIEQYRLPSESYQ